jgi:hypothetical protein
MKTAENHLLIFEGASAGQYPQRGNGVDRFADRQTRQGEPSGSERVNTCRPLNSGVPTPLAIRSAQAAFGSPTSSRQSEVSCRNGLYAIKSSLP